MSLKCPRRLNINAPILSTRKRNPSQCVDKKQPGSPCDSSDQMVPFSWEEVPGTPKGISKEDLQAYRNRIPALKPPPSQNIIPNGGGSCAAGGDSEFDILSDELDMYSLSESLQVEPEESSMYPRLNKLDLDIIEARNSSSSSSIQSPNFIIRRFLPAANALAFPYANSTSNPESKHIVIPEPTQKQTLGIRSRSVGSERSAERDKACGMEHFFPWRKKLTPCGLKSPVRGSFVSNGKLKCNSRRSKGSSSHNVFSLKD